MFSTRQAARKLGITHATLSRYITAGKVAEPQAVSSGGMTIHLWSDQDIEGVGKLLPKIKNGRKTRYQKNKKSEVRSRKSVKPKPKNIKKQMAIGNKQIAKAKPKPKTKKKPEVGSQKSGARSQQDQRQNQKPKNRHRRRWQC